MLDIVLAIDSLPRDFERSSRDIRGFCEELLNGLELGVDDTMVTLGTSTYDAIPFHAFHAYYNQDFFYFFDDRISQQRQQSHRLVEAIATILSYRVSIGSDGPFPRDDAPDVVIVFSEGDSTVEVSNFLERIEPRARYALFCRKHNFLYMISL